jgi:hypothetical protein
MRNVMLAAERRDLLITRLRRQGKPVSGDLDETALRPILAGRAA